VPWRALRAAVAGDRTSRALVPASSVYLTVTLLESFLFFISPKTLNLARIILRLFEFSNYSTHNRALAGSHKAKYNLNSKTEKY